MEETIKEPGILQRISLAIVNSLEKAFYRWGYNISLRPTRYILMCIGLVVLSSFGFFRFHREQQPVRLWLPRNSDFVRDTDWLMTNYGETYRFQTVIITADDVLQPHVLAKLEEIHRKIQSISAKGITWGDICFRIPALTINTERDKREAPSTYSIKRAVEKRSDVHFNENTLKNESIVKRQLFSGNQLQLSADMDPSVIMGDQLYCNIVNSLDRECFENSVLELWKYDLETISTLTKDDIICTLNSTQVSPVFGHQMNYVPLLGGIKRNASGVIVAAKAVRAVWVVHVNFSAVDYEESGNAAGTGDLGDVRSLEWEKKFIDNMNKLSQNATDMEIFFSSGRSFGDISNDAMFQDIDKLALGIIIMFIYIQLMLSKFNWVEIRLYLGMIGMLCIGMALVVSYGLCSMLGVFFGPVHNALPFLLLGIGIDDMFVIMQSWFNLTPAERLLSLPEKIGLTMKHAGASITVTSITDFVAFAIGATTILPCLQSFCLYAAVGILATYMFQSTFFVACLVWDQRRIEQNRNGILFCYQHKNYQPNACSQRYFVNEMFDFVYSKFILTIPGKVFVILTTVAITAISIKGNLNLKQEFDQMWFIPKNTHLANYTETRLRFYAEEGQEAGVYMGRLNYSAEFQKIHHLVQEFKRQNDILYDVESWTDGFQAYTNKNFGFNLPTEVLSDASFSKYISKYLFSPQGAKYQKNFRFNGSLVCGKSAPPVTVSSFDFKFRLFTGSEEHIPALHKVKKIMASVTFTSGDGFSTVWGKIFANWVTDEIIDHEMYRNLALAMLCVMITTFLLIANVQICLMVLICVVLTLIDVGGIMYFWGLTIDIVSCVGLVLAVGLCVDYAAHIGLAFLSTTGDRNQRAHHTVLQIGPAVMNGGLSTLLALSVLADSQAHVFISFFKIFLLVVVLGLFHGLVVLPVALSLIGPEPYQGPESQQLEERTATTSSASILRQQEQRQQNGAATTSLLDTSGDTSKKTSAK